MDYSRQPVPVNRRRAWEFQVCLTGRVAPSLPGSAAAPELRTRTMWVFPAGHAHGWVADAAAERIVFHYTSVPGELEKHVPPRGYYRMELTDDDCARIRYLTGLGRQIMERATELMHLQAQAVLSEISLMALREARLSPLPINRLARDKIEQALAWYREHLEQAPKFECVAEAVHVSPTHLRRLFRQIRNESPHQAFTNLRMDVIEELLSGTNLTLDALAPRVGFSSGSALSRAVKTHFDASPKSLRR